VHPVEKKLCFGSKNGKQFFDGLDELYHRAKFGEDRTMSAGCRCENVVFVTGRMPQSYKLPVLNLLTGQKSVFLPRRGDLLHRFTLTLAGPTGTYVRLPVQNFQSPQGVEMRPQNIKNFHFFGKESLRRGDSLDRFPNFLGDFIRLTIVFHISCDALHRLRSYC